MGNCSIATIRGTTKMTLFGSLFGPPFWRYLKIHGRIVTHSGPHPPKGCPKWHPKWSLLDPFLDHFGGHFGPSFWTTLRPKNLLFEVQNDLQNELIFGPFLVSKMTLFWSLFGPLFEHLWPLPIYSSLVYWWIVAIVEIPLQKGVPQNDRFWVVGVADHRNLSKTVFSRNLRNPVFWRSPGPLLKPKVLGFGTFLAKKTCKKRCIFGSYYPPWNRFWNVFRAKRGGKWPYFF